MNQGITNLPPLNPPPPPQDGSFTSIHRSVRGIAGWSATQTLNLNNYLVQIAAINNNKMVGTAVASAATIEVSNEIQHVTGSTTVTTITAASGQYGPLYLISDGGFSLGTGGNISTALRVPAGQYVQLIYDPATTTWYVEASVNGTPVTNEIPAGTINGTNAVFTLAHTPISGSQALYRNGLRQTPGSGNDYTITGATITFNAGNIPQSGDAVLADYRY